MPAPLPVADRLELADLVARYADAVDRRDFGALRDVFTADGHLDTGRGVREGIDAILKTMEGLRRFTATSHVLGQQLVESTDDGATGLTYCTAHHLTEHEDHRTDTVMHIRYVDRFVRVDRAWRIASRRLDVPWTDEQRVG